MGSPGYWLPYCVAAGTWQMEQDTWLLQRLRHAPRPYLRFYGWDRLTLSLGRHQAWPDPAPGIPVVRRPTGGRAVLHQAAEDGAELTYSLVLPLSYLQARLPRLQRASVYDFCCRFWVKGLAELGVEVDPILAHNRTHGQNRPTLDSGYRNKTSCFAARTRADLSWGGKKLMGNAQLWQPWGILQQGSLLLRPNFELWERYLPGSQVIGLYDLCPTAPGIPALMEHFLQMAQECFEVEWQEETWPDPLHWEDPAGIADPE
ncbi:lipoate--protein ligase family protein [Synechococcus sp. H60.2]|uniref:lipoyl protein ligase domain-containing protein n=1 Tax=Synechococcus sp. H60.2 TaxID=2964518 RepID=UPI0039C29884